jgi:ATP:corrinoid adenosyltransferase
MAKGLVEVMYHAMSRTAAVGTALAAVIVGFEGVTMTFLKREREEGRREGRHEGRREGMRERDREWKDWQERLKKDPNAEPPPPPKDDD